jgi:hypothetical protein
MKFRKKPVVIEARQLTPETGEEIGEWCGAKKCIASNGYKSYLWGWGLPIERRGLTIPTLEGDHHASMGDWIIQGVMGEFYPCKDEIFKMTYEPVNEGTARYEAYGLMGGDEFVSGHSMKRNLTGPSQ